MQDHCSRATLKKLNQHRPQRVQNKQRLRDRTLTNKSQGPPMADSKSGGEGGSSTAVGNSTPNHGSSRETTVGEKSLERQIWNEANLSSQRPFQEGKQD